MFDFLKEKVQRKKVQNAIFRSTCRNTHDGHGASTNGTGALCKVLFGSDGRRWFSIRKLRSKGAYAARHENSILPYVPECLLNSRRSEVLDKTSLLNAVFAFLVPFLFKIVKFFFLLVSALKWRLFFRDWIDSPCVERGNKKKRKKKESNFVWI